MKRVDIWSGAAVCVLALFIMFVVIPWQIDDVKEGYVAPRLVPQISMAFIVLLSALQVFTAARGEMQESATLVTRAELAALLKLSAIFALSLILYLYLSPLAAAVSLLAGSLLALGERRPVLIAGITGVPIFIVWLVFYRLLGTAIV
ncbi:hypothetical protein J2046_004036 [Rhizobium petrolearium]|uniref:tripartite tricarboxylate transporter TctB family protein n=1 Tax=Neorhizobium petrolearium TaxID=515361 RepID=UPI001AE1DE9B|nr:tripartite tricarboxylate transporter TctB family protein [Neorhizobium petrolearium]MBP1845762.1 hypothetical protein [Neorhizobium petrolearium]